MKDAPGSATGGQDRCTVGAPGPLDGQATPGDEVSSRAGTARCELEVLALLAESGVPARWLLRLDGADRADGADEADGGDEGPGALRGALAVLVADGVCSLSADGATVRVEDGAAVRAGMDDQAVEAAADRAARLLGGVRLDRVRDPRHWRREVEDLVGQLQALAVQNYSRRVLGREQGAAALAHAARLAPSPVTLTLTEAVDVLVEQMGQGHAHVLTARNSLAAALRATGEASRAVPLFEQVLEGTVALVGTDHPLTLTARNNLAGAVRDAGEPDRAALLYEEVVRDAERVLGPTHPDTLSARNNLAYAHECAGRLGQAVSELETLVDEAVRRLGEQHPYVPSFRRNLERVRAARGEEG